MYILHTHPCTVVNIVSIDANMGHPGGDISCSDTVGECEPVYNAVLLYKLWQNIL